MAAEYVYQLWKITDEGEEVVLNAKKRPALWNSFSSADKAAMKMCKTGCMVEVRYVLRTSRVKKDV